MFRGDTGTAPNCSRGWAGEGREGMVTTSNPTVNTTRIWYCVWHLRVRVRVRIRVRHRDSSGEDRGGHGKQVQTGLTPGLTSLGLHKG